MTIVSPSVLSADFANLESELNTISNAQYVHVDIMDGHFVPNISIGIPVVEAIRRVSDKILDVHLMISEPIKYVKRFCDAGADIVTIHLESDDNDSIIDALKEIKSCGKKAGLSIKPNTSADEIVPYLDYIDMILIMTVEPGFGGQKFMSDMVGKISFLRSKTGIDIEVDGGINYENGKICVDAGANVLVAGSYVFKSNNRKETINGLLSL